MLHCSLSDDWHNYIMLSNIFLSPIDAIDVKTALSDIVDEWRDLGAVLGFSHSDVQAIERNNPRDVKNCLKEVVDKWFKSGKPSWKVLCEALRHPLVKRIDIASKIEREYL